jgi:hypothetical protein
MRILELNLSLPEGIASEAEAAGLLQPKALQRLISEELRRRRVDRLFDSADRLAALDTPQMTEAELEAQIAETRAQRRAGNAGGR